MPSLPLRYSPELLWVPIRFVPLAVNLAFLGLIHTYSPGIPTGWDWMFALTSGALVLLGGKLPLVVLIGQSTLYALGPFIKAPAWAVLFVLAPVALAELWTRRTRWQCWVGTGIYLLGQLAVFVHHFNPLYLPLLIAILTVPPAALGVYIRRVLQVAVTAQRQRGEAVRDARAAERTAIARELHDLIAHYLASIALQVGAARHALGTAAPEVAMALSEVHDTARTGLADLRLLVATLRDPDTLTDQVGAALAEPGGLSAALGAAVERARGAGLILDAEIDPEVSTMDAMRRLALLRVVQEGLTNVIKHAGRQPHAVLRVHRVDGETRVLIRDDHGGRPATEPRTDAGFGLIGMRERVELLGGTVRAGSHPSGWELAVSIPACTAEGTS